MDTHHNVPSSSPRIIIEEEAKHLRLVDGPTPQPAADELLIKVHSAGVNRADLLQRKGHYPPPADASPILGLEVAGTVVATGDQAGSWQVGDSVCALTHGGGYAHYAVAPIGQCFPVPEGFSHAEAAALPEALLTIWHNVFQRAALQPGENILIHGGASGMGSMGVMICHAMGAQVYTTAGSAEKCAALEARGAQRAINYKEEDFETVLTEMELQNQINVVLDMVGGDYIQKNLNLAAPEARIVNIAYMQGFKAAVNFAPLLMKRITMTGSTLRAQSFAQKAVMTKEIIASVYPHLRRGAIKPIVDSIYPLEQAEEAHARMQSGQHMGKIILRC